MRRSCLVSLVTAATFLGAAPIAAYADYNGAASSGQSSSDAIVVVIGKNDVILNVLHADANSAGRGQSYLAAVNGNVIPGSDQARAACSAVPNVVSLTCLSTAGGAASQQSVAAAASVSGGRSLAAISSVAGSQTAARPSSAAPGAAPTAQQAGARPAARPAAVTKAPRAGGTLPFT